MAEFIGEEKVVDVGDPIIFENKTDSNYEVSAGIVFRKSGIYEVSIVGNRTIVSKVSERKKGKWNYVTHYRERYRACPICGCEKKDDRATGWNFCMYCGADMRGE